MVLYDLRCASGHRQEVNLLSMFAPNPPCSQCGADTSRIPALAGISGRASAGPSREDMPNTWRGIDRGDSDTVRHWHRQLTKREKLEEKYPELAGDRRPVLAHEGRFAASPLRAGDPLVAEVARATFATSSSSVLKVTGAPTVAATGAAVPVVAETAAGTRAPWAAKKTQKGNT